MNQLHLVITCPACGAGGSVASVACQHAKELARFFQVTLVSDSLPVPKLDGVNYAKVKHRRFDYLRRCCHAPNEYSFTLSVRRRLKKIHRNNAIDMVMCHGHALAALAGNPLKKAYNIPYTLITHGDIFYRPRGAYDWRLTAFYRAVTPIAYRNASVVLALSPYMASCAKKNGAKARRVHIVPNGIAKEDIGACQIGSNKRIKPSTSMELVKLLYVGAIHKIKGVDILIDACKLLVHKKVKFHLQMIGEGSLQEPLQMKIEKADLTHQITFLNKIPRDALGSYYKMADIVCAPSIDEPFGLVILEALLSGTPVVASNTGGIPYIIRNGFNGVLIPARNPQALANAIECLYKHPMKLNELARNAHISVFPRFSWTHIGIQIRDIITNAIVSQPS